MSLAELHTSKEHEFLMEFLMIDLDGGSKLKMSEFDTNNKRRSLYSVSKDTTNLPTTICPNTPSQ